MTGRRIWNHFLQGFLHSIGLWGLLLWLRRFVFGPSTSLDFPITIVIIIISVQRPQKISGCWQTRRGLLFSKSPIQWYLMLIPFSNLTVRHVLPTVNVATLPNCLRIMMHTRAYGVAATSYGAATGRLKTSAGI